MCGKTTGFHVMVLVIQWDIKTGLVFLGSVILTTREGIGAMLLWIGFFHENDRGYQTSGGRGTGKGIFLGIELHKKWDFFSAYHLSVQLKKRGTDSAECSNVVKAHKGWLDLRSTEVPGKVKIHVWRLAQNGLAVGHEL